MLDEQILCLSHFTMLSSQYNIITVNMQRVAKKSTRHIPIEVEDLTLLSVINTKFYRHVAVSIHNADIKYQSKALKK
jgi:hypothetical protein